MIVFVDTSAWFALASATDQDHAVASTAYTDLLDRRETLLTTSYVLAETMGLIQHRLGWEPLELFAAASGTWETVWIDAARHRAAETLLFSRRRHHINVVDAASFAVMQELDVEVAFAFDEDFAREGFQLIGL